MNTDDGDVSKNDAQTVNRYRKAAEQGKAMARCDLGCMDYTGEGVAKDAVEAAKWYRLHRKG